MRSGFVRCCSTLPKKSSLPPTLQQHHLSTTTNTFFCMPTPLYKMSPQNNEFKFLFAGAKARPSCALLSKNCTRAEATTRSSLIMQALDMKQLRSAHYTRRDLTVSASSLKAVICKFLTFLNTLYPYVLFFSTLCRPLCRRLSRP